jgi:hypothetical protein
LVITGHSLQTVGNFIKFMILTFRWLFNCCAFLVRNWVYVAETLTSHEYSVWVFFL